MAKPAAFPAPRLAVISTALLDDTPDEENPNQLSEEDFRGLVEAVTRLDFAQALTLMERPEGRFRIVDGMHRKRAAAIAKRQDLPAVIYPTMPEAQFRALRLALNRWRGDQRMSAVHEDLRLLHEAGVGRDLLFAAAGLPPEELDAVLGLGTALGSSGDLLDAGGDLPDPDASAAGKAPAAAPSESATPIIEIACSSAESHRELRALLLRAGRTSRARGKFKLEATIRAALQAYLHAD